eukprot:CAMPEP_0174861332 /NCGR_PEP_ID=MMETSP1114-20130205/51362_1 /TAXON_ID=312471 /ORGANISM="Neobodo designis, Strain CCAP 1951/1" /LENGTH=66 /DNA_ID=CAMNT_0016096343 /DNA_START=29 /DNA_END=226 /DNA_ORIENTATION=+
MTGDPASESSIDVRNVSVLRSASGTARSLVESCTVATVAVSVWWAKLGSLANALDFDRSSRSDAGE